MDTTFWFYRYFINETKQLVIPFEENVKKTKKERFIEAIKNKNIENFSAGKSTLGFVVQKEIENFLYCEFGRQSTVNIISPPDKKFQKNNTISWSPVRVFIDTNDNPNGQKIAIEHKTSFCQNPLEYLRKLADEINNELRTFGYEVSINPIATTKKFWDVISKNKDKIIELTFTYRVPNLFNGDEELSEELKNIKKIRNGTEASVTLSNREQSLILEPEDEFLKQSADYTSKGGGSYRMRVKGQKKPISSETNIESVSIDIDGINNTNDIMKIIKSVFQL